MKATSSLWNPASVRLALSCLIVSVHLSVKLKMSRWQLAALFADILWGQFTSGKDTCLFRQDLWMWKVSLIAFKMLLTF